MDPHSEHIHPLVDEIMWRTGSGVSVLKNDFNSSVSFHLRRPSAALLVLGWKAEPQAFLLKLALFLHTSLHFHQPRDSTEQRKLQKAKNSKIKDNIQLLTLTFLGFKKKRERRFLFHVSVSRCLSHFCRAVQIIHTICFNSARQFEQQWWSTLIQDKFSPMLYCFNDILSYKFGSASTFPLCD